MPRIAPDEFWERAEDVIALAATRQHAVTKDQLTRWHQARLLERPVQHSLGRHGSETLYPPGTATLVLEICVLKSRDRRLDETGWSLWWEGFPVDMGVVRDFLGDVAKRLVETFDELVTEGGNLTEKAEDMLDSARDTHLDSKTLRWVRRRTGTENFEFVLDSMLRVAGGKTDDLSDDDVRQLEHAIGMDRARGDVLASIGKPWVEGDPREDVENISQIVNPALLTETLKVATDDELCSCRDEARQFMTAISAQGSVLRETAGRWAFGLGAYGAFLDDMGSTHTGQAWLTLLSARLQGCRSRRGHRDGSCSDSADRTDPPRSRCP